MKHRKHNIVEKATELFMKNGLVVTMDDIALASGMSKKTVYENFQSKEEIVKAVVQKLIAQTNKYIRLCPDISPNAINEMENFSTHILSVLQILTPMFLRDVKRFYPEAFAHLIVFRDNTLIPYLERILTRGIKEEVFRSDVNVRNTGWLYYCQLQNVLEADMSHADVIKIIDNTNDLFQHAVLNSKGMKIFNRNKQHENFEKTTNNPG